jgi:site-specific DNA-methyltransferase (adenine-specific)
MEIEQISIDDLIPYINNPRDNTAAVDAVASSIAEFGFKVPLVVDRNHVVVTGHTRLLAAKKLGLTDVPCIVADDLSEAKIKAYRIADNKVAELASWNPELLQAELDALNELGVDMGDFGFSEEETEDLSGVTEVDMPEVDETEEPITQEGDLYQLGPHRLLCGDSTKAEDVQRLTGGGTGRPAADRPAVQRRLYRRHGGRAQDQKRQLVRQRLLSIPAISIYGSRRGHAPRRSFLHLACACRDFKLLRRREGDPGMAQ